NTATLRLNIALEIVIFAAQLIVLCLHGVADRDEADEPAALDHRHVADAALGHNAHDVGHFVVGRSDDGAARHAVGDLQEFERPPRGGASPQNVALGDDAYHLIVLHHDERANVVPYHQVRYI